ncbi:MAG: efflux RND transporter permease subunit [Proteobacteria bacterium]|nr:efflux RND transporter permease subunit [Pseudomonadota bacterium]
MNLIKLSIDRPKFITMLTAFFLVVGLLALKNLAVDLYPNVSYPVLVVVSHLEGAAPEEIEQLITRKVEDALSTVAGIKLLRSVSREGISVVIMEFDPSIDVRFQEIQVRGKIANLRASLPDTMKEPEIFRQDPDDTPIIEVAVTGDRTAAEMTKLANDVILPRLRQISGVGQVDLGGDRQAEIHVELKPTALDQWHLNPTDIVQAIRANNRNDPVGQVWGKDRIWLVRSTARAKNAADIAQIPVAKTPQGQPLYLRDVAEVTSGFQDITRVSRFGDKSGFRPAVILNVLKQSGENTVKVSDRVQKVLLSLQQGLPADVHMTITRDNADLVRENVADVYESLILGSLLTIAVVLLFLRSIRSTITTGIALPSSVITTFAVMFAAGFTINVMSLLALSLAIGLLVDDAIVVRENIYRHLARGTPKEAAEKGAKEVQLAVVATTLTIVAVFLPVGFMGGVSGQFFKQFALTVVFAVLVSLYDAMTMAPMLSAYFANIPLPSTEWAPFGAVGRWIDRRLLAFEHWFDRIAASYGRLLTWLVRRPLLPLLIATAAVVVAGWGFVVVKKSFIPTQFGTVFGVSLQGPLAIPVDRVLAVSDQAEQRIKQVAALSGWTVNAGRNSTGYAAIDMTLRVDPKAATNQKTLGAVRTEVRALLKEFPGYTVRISEPSDPLAGSTGRFQPLAVVVTGDSIDKLNNLARDVRTVMTQVPGVADVGQVQDEGLPEIQIRTDPSRAGQLGVTTSQISDALATWVQGDATNSIMVGDDEVNIRVRLKDGRFASADALLARSLYPKGASSKSAQGVALSAVSKVQAGSGAAVINRENRQRTVRIGANLAPGAALGDVVTLLQAKLDEMPLPQNYAMRISGQNEQMDELYTNVLWAIGIGILFVYMILVSLFESFTQPISVMAAIPLAATGAVLALLAFQIPLDLYGGVAMILLAGIVAKNSILLVDFAVQRVREGETPRQAILEAAPLRLRPIIMTSVAMIAGMVPVAAALGAGGEARRSLGIATIGGVISSTFLTLLVVPSLYLAIEEAMAWVRKRRHLRAAPRTEA